MHANDHYNISYYVLMRNIHFIATALINHETLDAFQMMRKRILIFINNRIEKMKRPFWQNRLFYVYGLEKST